MKTKNLTESRYKNALLIEAKENKWLVTLITDSQRFTGHITNVEENSFEMKTGNSPGYQLIRVWSVNSILKHKTEVEIIFKTKE